MVNKTRKNLCMLCLLTILSLFINFGVVKAEVYTPIDGDTGETEVARRTYYFYLNENDIESNNYFNKQILKNGETVVEPAIPSLNDGESFKGWYSYENGVVTDNKLSIIPVSGLTDSDEEVIYVARIQKFYQIRFIDVENNNSVIKTIKGDFNGENVTVSLSTINEVTIAGNVNLDRAQVAWSTEKNGSALTSDLIITKEGTIDLYPVYEEVKWLIFDMNISGDEQNISIAPQYLYGNKVTVKPTDPTRTGYTFDGWYKDKNCTQVFTFGNTLSQTTTIYAKWIPGQASYKIIHWIEVLPDNKKHDVYTNGSFDATKAMWATKSTVTKTGTVGSSVTISNSDKLSIPYYEYYTADTKVVKANGTTVINVYYRLKEYTYTFDLGDKTNRTSVLVVNGVSYNTKEYKITAVLDEDIYDRWPTDVRTTYTNGSGSSFYAWDTASIYHQVTKVYNMTLELIPDPNQTQYTAIALFGGKRWEEVNYWLQDANGEFYIDHVEYMEVVLTSGSMTGKSLAGFTFLGLGVTPEGTDINGNPYPNCDNGSYVDENGRTIHINNFYYIRNSYTITFEETGLDPIEVLYGAPIIGKVTDPNTGKVYEPNPRDGYIFMGWYEVQSGDVLLEVNNFETRIMPEHNLLFRPIWKRIPVTLTFEANGGTFADNTDIKQYEVEKGTKFTDDIPVATRNGYTFIGWVYKTGEHAGELYNFAETIISSDIVLEARWVYNDNVQVIYYTDSEMGSFEGSNESYIDPNEYADGVDLLLRGTPENVNENYNFIGWKTENSDTIYTDILTITSDIIENGIVKLYAVYSENLPSVTVTYYSNYQGLGTDKEVTTEEKINNDTYEVADPESMGISAPVGYKFAGWSKNPNGEGILYAVGSTIAADINSDNALYAIWVKDESQTKVLTYTVEHIVNGEVKDTEAYTVEVWINDPDTITIENGSLTPNTYVGYKFDSISPEVTEGQSVNTNTVIKLYYVATSGEVIIHYVDEDGNPIIDDVIIEGQTGDSYEVIPKEFDEYNLVDTIGQTTGTFTDGTIEISFVYEKFGTGGDEQETPQEPVVEPIITPEDNTSNPKTADTLLTSMLVSSLSLIGLIGSAIYLNKKEYVKID